MDRMVMMVVSDVSVEYKERAVVLINKCHQLELEVDVDLLELIMNSETRYIEDRSIIMRIDPRDAELWLQKHKELWYEDASLYQVITDNLGTINDLVTVHIESMVEDRNVSGKDIDAFVRRVAKQIGDVINSIRSEA